MKFQTDEFHPQAVERLFLAVVNQAIFDVLENKKEAKVAEQWLLSKEFDELVALLSRDAEGVRQRQQRSVA